MANLISKLAAASIEVGGKLNPDKRNKQDSYEYISADKILATAGQALATVGVVVFPTITSEAIERGQSSGGKGRYDAVVEFTFIVTDGESTLNATWVGRGSDYTVPDRALYKAQTSGHRYFLAKLLNIGAGNEDGEHEEAPTQEPQRQSAKPPVQKEEEFNGAAPEAADAPDPKLVKRFHSTGTSLYGVNWDDQRVVLVKAVTGDKTSSSDLTAAQMRKLCAGMDAKLAQAAQPDAKAK